MKYDNEHIWCVYIHENQINRKVYVGKSCLPNYRFGSNGVGYKYNKLFTDDIDLYGWDNFSHEIVYDYLTEKEALRLERFLINYYSANNPKYGYNSQSGSHGEVIQYSMDDEYLCKYNSVYDAAKAIGKNHGAIYSVLNGKRKKAFGYKWKRCY